ncbi:MAG TPA: HAMP domain-containing sensor histidine kinase [Pirellulales bacterium]|nr:HAMP domain-containing sensor histidine kinase [Pirellulales bacterium]
MLAKWPIRKKLVLCLGLLLAMVGTLGWGGIYGLYAYRSLVRSLGRRVPELPLADALSQRVGDLRVALSDDAPLVEDAQTGQPPRYHPNAPLVRYARQEFEACLANVKICLDQYRQRLLFNPDHEGQIGDSRQEWETVGEIDAILKRIDATIRDQTWLLDEPSRGALSHELEQLQLLAAQLPTHLYKKIGESTVDAKRQYRTLLALIWTISGAAVLLLGLFVHLFYRWVFRPLRILINGSRKVAQGRFDYRIRLQTHDEMSELAGAMNDMTARFQAIRDDLDRQVQERTKQVVRSEQLASVGFLAAGVAHEINNPLASIAMCAESLEGRIKPLLGEGDEHAVVRNYLQMIQNEAFRCKGITEKLLDFSRMGEVKRQPTELGELVEGVIEMARHLGKYQDKNIEFAPAEPVVVSANPQELKQVVLNLLANGLDSLDAGGTVKVDLRRQGNEAELAFADNGCGMTAEVQEHLFEPFFTRRRGGQGTGLGLSIVYRIVSDHEGTIDVHSEGPNRGSTFRVCLPLASAAVQTQKEKPYRNQAA